MFHKLSRALYNISTHYKLYGFEGLKLWKLKFAKQNTIKRFSIKNVSHPIYMRGNTSDYTTFLQVFVDFQYDKMLPEKVDVILDCGANIGLASIYFANKYPSAKIIAVEPESTNFEMLLRNTEDYSNITCLQKGIWDKKTNLKIIDNGEGNWGFTL